MVKQMCGTRYAWRSTSVAALVIAAALSGCTSAINRTIGRHENLRRAHDSLLAHTMRAARGQTSDALSFERRLNYLAGEIHDAERRHNFHGLETPSGETRPKIVLTDDPKIEAPRTSCGKQIVSIPRSVLEDLVREAVAHAVNSPVDSESTRQTYAAIDAVVNNRSGSTDSDVSQQAFAVANRELFKTTMFMLGHELSHWWFDCHMTLTEDGQRERESFADRIGVLFAFEQLLDSCAWESEPQLSPPRDGFSVSHLLSATGTETVTSIPPADACKELESKFLSVFDTELRAAFVAEWQKLYKEDPDNFKWYTAYELGAAERENREVDFWKIADAAIAQTPMFGDQIITRVVVLDDVLSEAEEYWPADDERRRRANELRAAIRAADDTLETCAAAAKAAQPVDYLPGDTESHFGRTGSEVALGVYRNTKIGKGSVVYLPVETRIANLKLLDDLLVSLIKGSINTEIETARRESFWLRDGKVKVLGSTIGFPSGCPVWQYKFEDEFDERFEAMRWR